MSWLGWIIVAALVLLAIFVPWHWVKGRAWKLSVGLVSLVTIFWCVGVLMWVSTDDSNDHSTLVRPNAGPRGCQAAVPEPFVSGSSVSTSAAKTADGSTAAGGPFELVLDGDQPVIVMGSVRGASATLIRLKLPKDSSTLDVGSIRATSTAFVRSGGGLLAPPTVAVQASGAFVIVSACAVVKSNVTWSQYTGKYVSYLTISGNGFSPLVVPLTVEVQARYLWLLAPWILWAALLSVALLGAAGTAKATTIAAMAAAGAAAGIFVAQGVSNNSWGGGLVPAVTLVAAMYVAAAGTVATVKATSGQSASSAEWTTAGKGVHTL